MTIDLQALVELKDDCQKDMRIRATISLLKAAGVFPNGIDLGDANLSGQVNHLIQLSRQLGGKRFLLHWKGDSKVPEGIVLEGHTIAWTQNAMITSKAGQHIGTYDRLIEFGGEARNDHVMMIYLSPDRVLSSLPTSRPS